MAAPLPQNESRRLAALRNLRVLDTPADPAFDAVVTVAAAAFGVPMALVSLVDEHRQWFKARVGLEAQETSRDVSFCAHALEDDTPLVVLDAITDPRFVANPLVTGMPGIRFYAGAPLITTDHLCVGTLCIADTVARDALSPAHAAMLKSLAQLVMNRIEAMGSLHYLDTLTMLPNRHRFAADLVVDTTLVDDPHDAAVTVVAVDVCGADYARDMLNALGHRYVEGYILQALARLQQALPPSTPLYRIDDTRFAFIDHSDATSPPQTLFQAIHDAFDTTVDHAGIPHSTKVTIGAVPVLRDDDPAELFRSLSAVTDDAWQRNAAWGIYDAAVDIRQRRTFNLLSALSEALVSKGQLSLHYQPRIRLADGVCTGVEALLRWTHPEMGPISPGQFIEAAEKTALIARITDWVLDAAIAQASTWHAEGHTFVVGINVSAVDLERDDFVDLIAARLQQYGVDPASIELEFTESAIIRDPKRVKAQLDRIRALGLHLAIDDFGAGYSNLSYLKRIPATVLKIDQSFVFSLMEDAKDQAIVPSMIRLGHDLDYNVVAEGIETEVVLDTLRAWGCDEGQGYWIARPMPTSALGSWLARRRRAVVAPPTPPIDHI